LNGDARWQGRYALRMSMRPSTMRRVLAAVLPTALAAALVAGCSESRMLLDSDVPLPDGMTTVRSADIRRSRGLVTGGRFLLAGSVPNAADLLDATTERFRASGWMVVREESGLDLSSARFAKANRTVDLTITRRALDPDMSTAVLEVVSAVP
jgi:hypothetical protein